MNFLKPTKSKIILTAILGFVGIFFLWNPDVINMGGIIFVVIFAIFLLVPFFIPAFVFSSIKMHTQIQGSQCRLGPCDAPMPGTLPPVDLSFILQAIISVVFLYLWVCILFSIFKIINNRFKKYLYEKYQKPRQGSL